MTDASRIIDRGIRTVDNVTVTITELVAPGGGRTFEVHRADTGEHLTGDAALDTRPGDDLIRRLLDDARHVWRCPGCAGTVEAQLTDLIDDHLRDCTPQRAPATRRRSRP